MASILITPTVKVPLFQWFVLSKPNQSLNWFGCLAGGGMIYGCNCRTHLTFLVLQVKLSDSQVITLQVFSFSAGSCCQVGRGLAQSLAVITQAHPLIKHTPKLAMWGTSSQLSLFLSSWAFRSALFSPPRTHTHICLGGKYYWESKFQKQHNILIAAAD